MHIFIDDSDTFRRNGYQCLAGLMASDTSWDRFNNRWEDLLRKYGLNVIHTAEFLSGNGLYRDFHHDYEMRLAILQEFMDVVRDEVQCGVFCAIDAGEYRETLAHAKKKLKPEEFLFRRILKRSFEYMIEIRSIESIGVWLDDSDLTSTKFLSIWARTKRVWKLEKSMLGSIAFGDDRALYPLQGADLVANILARSHAIGVEPWNGRSQFSRLFIHPETRAVATHIRGEIWEAKDLRRLQDAIVDLASIK